MFKRTPIEIRFWKNVLPGGFTRKLILLMDRQTLLEDEQTIISEALVKIETDRRLTAAKKLAAPILAKYWDPSSRNGRIVRVRSASKERRELLKARHKNSVRFHNTVFAITEACSNNDELIVPELTVMQRSRKET